jgi:hypothetical protein
MTAAKIVSLRVRIRWTTAHNESLLSPALFVRGALSDARQADALKLTCITNFNDRRARAAPFD